MAAFIIDQHGCAKNTVDAQTLASHLLAAGHTLVLNEAEAVASCGEDGEGLVVIINSCGFIESAKQESIAAVMNARKRFPRAKILLAGCLAQRYSKQLSEILTEADGIFGNGDLSMAADVVAAVEKGERPVIVPPQKGIEGGRYEGKMLFTRRDSAYVKLTEGCNNRCTFCAIPIIRGQLRSRPVADVMDEVRALLANGTYEINFIGQDVASYPALIPLLDEVTALEGRFIVRLLYMHPDRLIAGELWKSIAHSMQKDSRIVPYFDIPFQSGNDNIIRAMGRRGTAEEYIALVEGIRKELPSAAIRTTFMAGFPGEDADALADTVCFLQEIKADWAGCFVYSREEDTPAYDMKGRVSKKIAAARMNTIISAQEEVTRTALAARLGQDYDVIIEEIIPWDEAQGEAAGYSGNIAIGRAWFQAPEVDGAFVVQCGKESPAEGSIVRARADEVIGVDIAGRLL